MKKLISIVLCSVLAIVLFTACGEKLPEGVTEEMVLKAGETAIYQLSDGDLATFAESLTQEMHTALAKDKDEIDALAEIWSQLNNQGGEYEKIEKSSVNAKGGFAVYTASLKFINANITATISFDKDLKIAGLFFK